MTEPAACIQVEIAGRIARLTLDRPAVRNAVNAAMAQGIEAALDRIEDDPEIWLGIIAGNGPVFSSGADLREAAAGRGSGLSTERGGFAGIVRRQRSKPLIAAVEGPALAGGCEIVLACDMVVASTAASFGIPEVKRGLVAAAGGLFRLARLLPRNIAMQVALTGEPIDARLAAEFGLVNVLTEPGGALAGALDLAQRILANAPLSVRASRRLILETACLDDADAFRLSQEVLQRNCETEDFQEGLRAFLEKRPPRWAAR